MRKIILLLPILFLIGCKKEFPEITTTPITKNAISSKTSGRYIVLMKDNVSPSLVATNYETTHIFTKAVKGFSAKMSSDEAIALRNNPNVFLVENDIEVSIFEQSVPYGIQRISATNGVDGVDLGIGQNEDFLYDFYSRIKERSGSRIFLRV